MNTPLTISLRRTVFLAALFLVCMILLTGGAQQSLAQSDAGIRIAAGQTLPITVKLTNFGSERRVDVKISYTITNATGGIIARETETVAVDTTASFVKQLAVPPGTAPGVYQAESSIQYPYQTAPAESSFHFTVERMLFGFFMSDVVQYGGLAFFLAVVAFVLGRLFIHARARRSILHDYSDKPKDERIYYEIISDTISQMRQRVGDQALDVALQLKGLKVDEKTGRVLSITESPAKVVAELVSGYEASLGRKVSFALRKEH